MSLLDEVTVLLDAHAIPHALIGAAALAAAGIARSTYDIDLLTADSRVLENRLWEGLAARGASVEIRRGDVDDPLGGVVRIDAAHERPVDVILARHPWQARLVERARAAGSGPAIVSPPDLILLKLYAGGAQDLWDVRELLRLPDAGTWAATVDGELGGLPDWIRERWHGLRKGIDE